METAAREKVFFNSSYAGSASAERRYAQPCNRNNNMGDNEMDTKTMNTCNRPYTRRLFVKILGNRRSVIIIMHLRGWYMQLLFSLHVYPQ